MVIYFEILILIHISLLSFLLSLSFRFVSTKNDADKFPLSEWVCTEEHVRSEFKIGIHDI